MTEAYWKSSWTAYGSHQNSGYVAAATRTILDDEVKILATLYGPKGEVLKYLTDRPERKLGFK